MRVDPISLEVPYNYYHLTGYAEELKWKLAIRLNKDKHFRLLPESWKKEAAIHPMSPAFHVSG